MVDEYLMSRIVDCAYIVYRKLGKGFLEIVYRKAMMMELAKLGISAEAEVPLTVSYDGQEIGSYRADIIVEKKVILELKAVRAVSSIHTVQLVHYLKVTGFEVGLVLNFGADNLEIKRRYPDYNPVLRLHRYKK